MATLAIGDIVARIKADTAQFDSAMRDVGSSVNNVEKGIVDLGKIAKIVGVAVATGTALIGKEAIKQADLYEQSSLAFETMLGSAEKAKNILRDLANMAKKTPFTIQGIELSAKQLLAMGIEAEKVVPTLKAIGDVSSALSVDLGRVAYNFGQVKAQGHLTGVELRDFARAGVPLIAELATNLNKTEAEIKEMVSAGEIGFADVEEAFITMTSEGGKFYNMMEVQSSTFSGLLSNLKDELTLLWREIGEQLLPYAKEFIVFLREKGVPALKGFFDGIKDLIEVFKVLKDWFEKNWVVAEYLMIMLGTTLLLAVGKLAVGFSIGLVSAVFNAISAFIALQLTLAPMFIVGGVIALLYVFFDFISRKTTGFTLLEQLQATFEYVKDGARALIEWLDKAIDKINIFKKKSDEVGKSAGGGGGGSWKASGGLVDAGKSYIVGELGAELFVPQVSGRIISNNDLLSMKGGFVQNINVYPSDALDLETIVNRLAFMYRTEI